VQHIHARIHLLPVLVSALIQWLIGAVWYSPLLFAKPWAAMVNVNPAGKQKTMVGGMIASFACSLLVSLALDHFIVWSHAASYGAGAFIGFISWFGFVAAPQYPQGIYEGRPAKLIAINTGYWLIALLITGAMLAVWH
jgi:hypothetical protein